MTASALARTTRRYCKPAAVLPRPAVGVAPRSGLAIRCGVAGSGMDDREVAHHANFDVMRLEIFDRNRHRGLLEKAGAVDQRLVGIATIEVVGENFVEPLHVRILHRGDTVSIERLHFVDVLAQDFPPPTRPMETVRPYRSNRWVPP